MDDKNRVGIAGYWFATNYGGVASYYSLYKKVEELGYKPFLIEDQYYYISNEGPDVFSRNFFKEENFNIAKCFTNDKLNGLNDLADIFLVGSDQVFTSHSMKSWGQVFLLGFADDTKKKIAYSSSCGGDTFDNVDPVAFAEYKTKLQNFNHISAREFTGIDSLKYKFEVNSKFAIDPIYFTTPEQYKTIGDKSGIEHGEKYMLAYILDPTEDKRKCIEKISKQTGLSVKIALDGRKFTHEKNVKLMNMDDAVLPELNFKEWMSYYTNASYIFTDSFHGASMSVILNKPFVMYANYGRGYPRFITLCQLFGIRSKMIEKYSELTKETIADNLNWNNINEIKAKRIAEGIEWLKNALSSDVSKKSTVIDVKKNSVIAKLHKDMCTGCAACVNACPVNALRLEPDDLGYYRSTIDTDKCIDCGLCSQICPALKLPENKNSDKPELYEFITSDEDLLFKSSSGGVFSVLAKEAFKRNGCVVGAAWTDGFSVKHIIIDNEEDMPKLRKSKYLQSYVGLTFREVKQRLENGRFVLFSGCPCQTAGLKAYLKKDYENLIIIDILCGNAPSAMFFKKYIEEDFDVDKSQLKSYEFRTKKQGWNSDCLTLTLTSGQKILRRGIAEDNYQRVYHSHIMCSQHCENCKYQNVPRFGDITIGDFWGIENKDKEVEYRKGISAVLINNQKGKDFFNKIPPELTAVKKQVPFEWLGGNGFAPKGAKNFASPQRNDFYSAIKIYNFSHAADYARKPNHGVLVHRYGRDSLPALNYDIKSLHFSFDRAYWEEHYINGATVLTVRPGMSKPGHYATIPLNGCLNKGTTYIMNLKFMVNTKSDIVNFHIKDSGSNAYQVIYTHKVGDTNNKWVEIQTEFVPKQRYFDQFMVGAAQVSGTNAFVSIAYVNILEKEF